MTDDLQHRAPGEGEDELPAEDGLRSDQAGTGSGVSGPAPAGGPAPLAVAADLFYRPGGATVRAIGDLYEAIDLDPAPAGIPQEVPCRL